MERDERILAWASTGSGAPGTSGVDRGDGVLVATNRGLWLPDGRRLGWHDIHKAAWSGRELRITPAEVAQDRAGYAVLVDAPAVSFLLLDPGELPDQVRTRVSRSVAYTTHHPMNAGGVRVVGRRVSGQNGLFWAVRYDAGTPVDLPAVIEFTDELVASAQGVVEPRD